MGPPPLLVAASDSCRVVVERNCATSRASQAIVSDEEGRALGIVTEQDVTRRIACSGNDDASSRIGDEFPRRQHLVQRIFCITPSRGWSNTRCAICRSSMSAEKIVGVLQLHQAMAVAAAPMMRHIARLSHDDDLQGMKSTKDAQMQVALELMDDGLPSPEIQALLSRINNDLYGSVLRLCLDEMAQSSMGAPPVAFDVIVMGSGGRAESLLRPDQDNGFVIADYPSAEHNSIDAWFVELAVRVTDALAHVGFEYCHGNVMATNPVWRKTLSEWRAQTGLWLGKSEGLALRYCDIFFDFACVYGSGELATALREHVTALSPRPFFLRQLFKVDEEHGVALGLFDRLKPDPLAGPNQGKLNLKLTGTLPLVGAIRIMALRERIEETGTLDRIAGLHARGVLDSDEQDYLRGAYGHISAMLLRQQLQDYRAGSPPGNHVPLEALSERERHMLVDGFKAIRALRSRLRQELTGEIF